MIMTTNAEVLSSWSWRHIWTYNWQDSRSLHLPDIWTGRVYSLQRIKSTQEADHIQFFSRPDLKIKKRKTSVSSSGPSVPLNIDRKCVCKEVTTKVVSISRLGTQELNRNRNRNCKRTGVRKRGVKVTQVPEAVIAWVAKVCFFWVQISIRWVMFSEFNDRGFYTL